MLSQCSFHGSRMILQVFAIALLSYVELFLLRRWTWGTFDASRPLVMLREMPLSFLLGELIYFLTCCVLAFVSVRTSLLAIRSRFDEISYSLMVLTFIASLSLSLLATLTLAVFVERIALGT